MRDIPEKLPKIIAVGDCSVEDLELLEKARAQLTEEQRGYLLGPEHKDFQSVGDIPAPPYRVEVRFDEDGVLQLFREYRGSECHGALFERYYYMTRREIDVHCGFNIKPTDEEKAALRSPDRIRRQMIQYRNGRLHGITREWDNEGKLIDVRYYHKGALLTYEQYLEQHDP